MDQLNCAIYIIFS